MIRALKVVTLTVLTMVIMGCGGGTGKKPIHWKRGPMPFDGNFDGVYQSDFGRMELTVSGTSVSGLYEDDNYNGRLQGEIRDNTLEFTWTQWNQEMRGKIRQTTGTGIFQYVVDEVPVGETTKFYHRLEGWWGYADGDLVNRWNASKLSARAKKKLEPWVPEAGAMDDGSGVTASGFEDAEAPAEETESAEPAPEKKKQKKKQKEEEVEDDILGDIF